MGTVATALRDYARTIKEEADRLAEDALRRFMVFKGISQDELIKGTTREMLTIHDPVS